MTPIQQILLGAGGAKKKTYMDDVFSNYLYQGNATNRSIVNGIDIAGKGGMVWTKSRTSSYRNRIFDTERGIHYNLKSDIDQGQSQGTTTLTAFNNNGFSLGIHNDVNQDTVNHFSWTFAKAPGFFDIVKYTGNGTNGRQIAHSLGSVPGCIMVKRIDATGEDWMVYHRGNALNDTYSITNAGNYWLALNQNSGKQNSDRFYDVEPTSTYFTVSDHETVNTNTYEYIAYVFGGGPSKSAGANSINFNSQNDYIKCGDASNTTADFNFGTGDLTIECWIKCGATQGTYPRVVAFGPQWEAEMAAIQWDHDNNANKVTFYCYNHSSSTTDPLLESSVKSYNNDGQWHHVAVTRSGNDWKLFCDGVLEDSESWSGSTNTANSYCTIGNTPGTATTAWFGGFISNVRVVKGTALYTSSFKRPTKAFTSVTNTKLLCCNAASATSATVTPITLTEASINQNLTESPFDDPDGFLFGESGEESIIKCGEYKGTGLNDGPLIDLGWEPQWIMIKNTGGPQNWLVLDSMRGIIDGDSDKFTYPNDNTAEASNNYLKLTPTGFQIQNGHDQVNTADTEYVYMAIRRPDGLVGKPVTTGTDVFAIDNGNSSSAIPCFDSGFPVDFALLKETDANGNWYATGRIVENEYMFTDAGNGESTASTFTFDHNAGWQENSQDASWYSWMWKRHAGFDFVTYIGKGTTNQKQPHSLGRVPEMIWVKRRDNTENWAVYHKGQNSGTNPEQYTLALNTAGTQNSSGTGTWSTHSATHFGLGTGSGSYNWTNVNGDKYWALLFASVEGVSKVGSYTGTAASLDITTGFQPRFLMLKREDAGSSGTHTSWFVLDTSRGWSSGNNDAWMRLDNQDTGGSHDFGSPSSNGFNITAGDSNYNGNGARYIYYAHA